MKRLLIIVPLFALAGCGGGSSDDRVAGPSDDRGQAQLRYARCLRENGVPNYPDDPRRLPAGGLAIPDRATKACENQRLALGGTTIDANDPKTRDRFLELARCMRAAGFDWPDPAPGSLGGPAPDLKGVRNKPRMEAAIARCQKGSG